MCGGIVVDEGVELLREIAATLKSIDTKLAPTDTTPAPNAARTVRLGRVFATGTLPPPDLDLVTAGNGQRWIRDFDSDLWHPRDADGPTCAWNELLAQFGHVTEIPPPDRSVT